mmetsp:Transcript_92355/g.224205  ORF Transcript_92355/g.224205 Transcript_92355/m.224205 type:complete len:210 (+) Transcript_92355:807-1436(+)
MRWGVNFSIKRATREGLGSSMISSPERILVRGSRVILSAKSATVSAGLVACAQSQLSWETFAKEKYRSLSMPRCCSMWRYWKRRSSTRPGCSRPACVSLQEKYTLVPAEVLSAETDTELASPKVSRRVFTKEFSPPYMIAYSMYCKGWLRYSFEMSGSGKKTRSSDCGCMPSIVAQWPVVFSVQAAGSPQERRVARQEGLPVGMVVKSS